MPKTIVHLVHEQIGGIGGIQRFDLRVMNALARLSRTAGFELIVIALRDLPPGFAAPAEAIMRTAGGSYWRLLWLLFTTHLRSTVSQVLIGHVRLMRHVWITRLLFMGTRYSLFVHGIEVWPATAANLRQRLWGLLLRAANEVISVSHYTIQRMAGGFHVKRFHVLPNAIDVEPDLTSQPLASSAGADGQNVILSVTRLAAHDGPKGIDFALRALARVRERYPQIRYRIVGDGVLRPGLEQLTHELGIQQNVEFLGRLPDAEVDAAFKHADIFLLPSRKEGFGIVFLEAWKLGLPVVCGNVDASSEVVTDKTDGFTVDPCSPEAIAAALEGLLADTRRRREFATNGRSKILTRYSNEVFGQNLARLLSY
jgi:glycosyltransferase involved in cell wall biosynthesis